VTAAWEHERKFIVPYSNLEKMSLGHGTWITQGYFRSCGVRVRHYRPPVDAFYLTLKVPSASSKVSRWETEERVGAAIGESLLHACDYQISKVRHKVKTEYAWLTWEIDIFAYANDGLVLAEIELPEADTPVEIPDWCGDEVTEDSRYNNANLARTPVDTWHKVYLSELKRIQ
jgi:adenylate cyclase